MSIQIGERIPDNTINRVSNGIQATSTREFFAGRKVVLFAVPGAFTPTCSNKHLPGFIAHLAEFDVREKLLKHIYESDRFHKPRQALSDRRPKGFIPFEDV